MINKEFQYLKSLYSPGWEWEPITMIWIYDNHINNFIQEGGLYPLIEEKNRAGYRRTAKLKKALESYENEFLRK